MSKQKARAEEPGAKGTGTPLESRKALLVLGMHRSGTSALAGLFAHLGARAPKVLLDDNEWNPKGHWESAKLSELHDRILAYLGSSWRHWAVLPPAWEGELSDSAFADELLATINEEFDDAELFVAKDPRICRLTPFWLTNLRRSGIEPKAVLTLRDPLEVVGSLERRNSMPAGISLLIWLRYNLDAELATRDLPRSILHYDALLKDWRGVARRVGRELEVDWRDWSPEAEILIDDFIATDLRHERSSFKKFEENGWIAKTYSYLSALAGGAEDSEHIRCKLDAVRSAFDQASFELAPIVKRYELWDRERRKEAEHLQGEVPGHIAGLEIDEDGELDFFFKLGAPKAVDEDRRASRGKSVRVPGLVTAGRKIVRWVSLDAFLPGKRRRRRRQAKEQAVAEIIQKAGIFDDSWYTAEYPDVLAAGMVPLGHYLSTGIREGRNPNPYFDTEWYLLKYPDVSATGKNPLLHFAQTGALEGRDPGPKFSTVGYLARHPELVFSEINPLGHFLFREKQQKAIRRTGASGPEARAPVDRLPHASGGEAVWVPRCPTLDLLTQTGQGICEEVPAEIIAHARTVVAAAPPRISVVMPTWNRWPVVARAIRSILSQSFLPFEIIVSDDGSTDRTCDELRNAFFDEFQSGLIRIIAGDHRGVSAARNAALRVASGDIVTYLDSDNVWREHHLLLTAAVYVESDEISAAYSGVKILNHDNDTERVLAQSFDRKNLLTENFIDLNVFSHRYSVFEQYGGFDENLRRLVDWDLVLRYTKNYEPAFLPFIGVDYYLDKLNLENITFTESLEENRAKVMVRTQQERISAGLDHLRIAYFLYDYPALSQTFVLAELEWLVSQGYDVVVYYATSPDQAAEPDFDVPTFKVKNANELAEFLQLHDRNICHTHFAYPGVPLFVKPACLKAGVSYTFMPHAVDIFHHDNRVRNRVGEVARDPLCLRVFVYGDHHKDFLVGMGVPTDKISYNFQAVETEGLMAAAEAAPRRAVGTVKRGVVFARFIEKKGIRFLIEAASRLKHRDVAFDIYGYGPLSGELEELAVSLGTSNVHFRGIVEGKEALTQIYAAADFLVAPCVEAANGDMDGFPTVILEAIAAGVPVIASAISAVPDYLRDGVEAILVPPGDVERLRAAIESLLDMPAERRHALVNRGRAFLENRIGVEKTMETLLDVWEGYSIDIILVTFNTEKYEDRVETYALVKRIMERTTTPYTLTIIDNDSDADFWDELRNIVRGNASVRLIRKSENRLCGPATNIAMSMGGSEFAIYVCSKEGGIKEHGWERALIKFMRAHKQVMLGGHKVHLPKYTYGEELTRHPEFSRFRNQSFASENPRRAFRHIQGGLFIGRRKDLLDLGGFNPETPQGNMDVELSYFLESEGHELGEIPQVASVTVKTLPRVTSILSEETVAAHPFTLSAIGHDLDSLKDPREHRCNICNWRGAAFDMADGAGQASLLCPQCQSTTFGRSAFRLMANDYRAFRGEVCAILSGDAGLHYAFGSQMFELAFAHDDPATFLIELARPDLSLSNLLLDMDEIESEDEKRKVWEASLARLDPGGQILAAAGCFHMPNAPIWMDGMFPSVGGPVQCVRNGTVFSVMLEDITSDRIGYDWRRFVRVVRGGEVN